MLLKDMMTPHVEVVHPDAMLEEAAEKMKELDVGPLPVCDGERLVGIVSLSDLAVHTGPEELADEELAEVLEEVSAPAEPRR
jgi:CBS-domain-containing membrane protein